MKVWAKVVGCVVAIGLAAVQSHGDSALFGEGEGAFVDGDDFDRWVAGKGGNVIACVGEGGVVEDDEGVVVIEFGECLDEVVGVATNAWKVVGDVASVDCNAHSVYEFIRRAVPVGCGWRCVLGVGVGQGGGEAYHPHTYPSALV